MKTIYFIFGFFIISTFLAATIINVPGDQPTIQEGIDVAVDGDTVLVQPDTYIENINYNGNNITVASLFLTTQDTTYISQTIIDGDSCGSVVTFISGEDETAILIGLTITNGDEEAGSGIYCENSSPKLQNLIITGNYAGFGGGICCWDNSSPTLTSVTITGNSANEGGGIHCDSSSPILENVTITGNSVVGHGGGIDCALSNLSLDNVTITGNLAYQGGGIHCHSSSPILENVTITDNSATFSGGIYCLVNANPTLMNCILWNDFPEEIYFCEGFDPNSSTISYSDIQGGEAGIVTNSNGTVYWLEGNIDEDPLFVGTREHPYSLQENSPCIDAGTPDTTGLSLPSWDIIGNLRIWDGDGDGIAVIDMGAYEYGAPPYVDVDDCQLSIVDFQLYNYPNPFNPSTTISFQFSNEQNQQNEQTKLEIYNVKGQKVKTLMNERLEAGKHTVVWNGRDSNDKQVSSGIYFYKLKAGDFQKVRKMLLMK